MQSDCYCFSCSKNDHFYRYYKKFNCNHLFCSICYDFIEQYKYSNKICPICLFCEQHNCYVHGKTSRYGIFFHMLIKGNEDLTTSEPVILKDVDLKLQYLDCKEDIEKEFKRYMDSYQEDKITKKDIFYKAAYNHPFYRFKFLEYRMNEICKLFSNSTYSYDKNHKFEDSP